MQEFAARLELDCEVRASEVCSKNLGRDFITLLARKPASPALSDRYDLPGAPCAWIICPGLLDLTDVHTAEGFQRSTKVQSAATGWTV